MPPLPDVPKVIKTALIFTDGINVDIVTRFYLEYSGAAPGSDDLDTYAQAVKDEFETDLLGDLNENLALIRVECIDLSTTSSAEGSWVGSLPGTATDPPNAVSVALVSSYEIARRYRGGHPRGYWPLGQSTNLATPQTWDSGFVATIHTQLSAFFTGIRAAVWTGGGSLVHVNVSYFEGFTVVTDPVTGRARNVPTVRGTPLIDTVTSRIERIRIGTQRRRLQY
jgi:hypothetical protein